MDVVDVCAGAAGGWSLGLHRAGMTTRAAIESEAWRRELYAMNNPGVKLYGDLRTVTGDQLRADGVRCDLLAGSPPCKEYSGIGSGGGLDADDLFIHAVRLAGELRPRWCAFENSHFVKERGYDRIASALEALNYQVWPIVVGARAFGSRHDRPRAVILAADLSRPQGRPARQPRPDRYVGDGPTEPPRLAPRVDCGSLGPGGSASLSRHLREYDGVPAGVAEAAREAYGDAVLPQLTEAVGRAIIAAEAALCL